MGFEDRVETNGRTDRLFINDLDLEERTVHITHQLKLHVYTIFTIKSCFRKYFKMHLIVTFHYI